MTDEELNAIWQGDLLGRKEEAVFLLQALLKLSETNARRIDSGSYVINVDADWGFGKTFFMRRFTEHLKAEGHKAVYIDAWKDDYANDPFTAVLSEIDTYLKSEINIDVSKRDKVNSYWATAKKRAAVFLIGTGKAATKRYVGDVVGEISDMLKDDVPDSSIISAITEAVSSEAIEGFGKLFDEVAAAKIEEFNLTKKSTEDFASSFGKVASELLNNKSDKRFFVIVDELDRCRPTYAIEMLERIKHLFGVSNVVFILSTNTAQLAHAVTAIYGTNFNGQQYLRRFFNRTYTLSKPSNKDLMSAWWGAYGVIESAFSQEFTLNKVSVLAETAKRLELSYRDIERLMDITSLFTKIWRKEHPRIDPVMLFVLAGLYVRDEKFGKIGGLEDAIRNIAAEAWSEVLTDQSSGKPYELDISQFIRHRHAIMTRDRGPILSDMQNEVSLTREKLSTNSYFQFRVLAVENDEINQHGLNEKFPKPFVGYYLQLISQAGSISSNPGR